MILFSIIAKQQRYKAVVETNDGVRLQTAKRRDARSVDAYENTWKCGELTLYFSPSAGG